MDEVASHTGNKTTTDGRDTKNGKKRAKVMEPKGEIKRRRVKVEKIDDKISVVKIKKVPKQKAPNRRAKLNGTGSKDIFIQPIWNVFKTKTPRPPKVTQSQEQPSLTELKPRIWTSSREELAVLLPELAGPKCTNGVSWLMYETPMVLLDESTTCFDIALHEDSVTLDLLTTRGFTCSWPPMSEKMPVPPESPTVNDVPDGNHSNWSTRVTSSSKNLPTTRTEKSAPTATTVLAGGPTDLAQTPPEDAALIDVSLPSPTYTPHEPSVTWSEGFTPAVPIYSPEGDFSVPNNYVHEPVAGGFSVPLVDAQPHKEIGNTATMHQTDASSSLFSPWVGREQNYLTDPLMTTDHSYKAKYTVSTNTSYTKSVVVDEILSQAAHEYNHHPFSDNLTSANIALNAGPSSWIDLDLNKPHPSDPTKPGLQATEIVESTNHASDEAKVKQIQDAKALQDTFIPSTVPEEIQAIIDSYLSGRPLLLVISNKRFLDYWSLRLPKEFGFLMLGYFRILGVQESRVHPNDPAPPLKDSSELMTGRVKWCFRLQWSPGGEEWILPNHDKNLLEHPWWKLPSPQSIPKAPPSHNHDAMPSIQAPLHTTHYSRNNLRPSSPCLDNASVLTLASSAFGPPHRPGSHNYSPFTIGDSASHYGENITFPDTESTSLGEDERLEVREFDASLRALRPRSSRRESEVSRWSPRIQRSGTPSLTRERSLWTSNSIRTGGFSDGFSDEHGEIYEIADDQTPGEITDSSKAFRDVNTTSESPPKPMNITINQLDAQAIDPCFQMTLAVSPVSSETTEVLWFRVPTDMDAPLEEIPSLDTQSIDNLIFDSAPPGVSQEIPARTPPLVASTFEYQATGDKDLTTPFEPESTFDTTPRYRAARLSNVDYEFRHVHFRELYHSLVPLQLLAPYGRTMLDSSFPRGWLCETCGKMNFQAALRHRLCSSSFCKGLKPQIGPYAVELMSMRAPQDNLSMVLPYNEPLLINLVDTWEDGTRTLPYYIHVLQLEATRLLHFIQLEVELVRPIGENGPYFQYSAHALKDDPSPTTSEWPNVPLSINHAKDWIQHQAIWFGELQEGQLSINHLCLLAWVTSGTKRGPATVRAKEKCVVFHAFGCNITVMVTPLSSKTTPVKVDGVDIDSLGLITMDNLPLDEPDVNPGWIAGLDKEDEDEAVEDPSHEDRERRPATNSKKASNPPFLFTLVHGDVLVFYGDDFEYSLKRGGTSFLLITSHQNDP